MIKQAASSAAQKIARELLEVLKDAREQVTGTESLVEPEIMTEEKIQNSPQSNYADLEARSKIESKRLLDALEAELAQIRKQREMRDEQRKQQQEMQNQQIHSAPEFMAPVGKKSGKIKNAFGAMKKKLADMSSRGEKQRNVSG